MSTVLIQLDADELRQIVAEAVQAALAGRAVGSGEAAGQPCWLKVGEAARLLGVNRVTLSKMIAEGKVPPHALLRTSGRNHRVSRAWAAGGAA